MSQICFFYKCVVCRFQCVICCVNVCLSIFCRKCLCICKRSCQCRIRFSRIFVFFKCFNRCDKRAELSQICFFYKCVVCRFQFLISVVYFVLSCVFGKCPCVCKRSCQCRISCICIFAFFKSFNRSDKRVEFGLVACVFRYFFKSNVFNRRNNSVRFDCQRCVCEIGKRKGIVGNSISLIHIYVYKREYRVTFIKFYSRPVKTARRYVVVVLTV